MMSQQEMMYEQPIPLTRAPEHFYEDTKWRVLSQLIWVGFVLLVLLGVCVYGLLFAEGFSKVFDEPRFLLRQFFPLVLLVPPMVMIVAAGGVDLSVGSVAGLSSVIIAALVSKGAGIGSAVAAAMLISLMVGLINGTLVGLLRIHGALVTLGMMVLLRAVAFGVSDERTIFLATDEPGFIGSMWESLGAWGVIVVYLAGCVALAQLTPFGRRPSPRRALRESWLRRAAFVGPPYVLSSLMAGIVGAHYVGFFSAADPNMAIGLEMHVLFAVALGGVCIRGRYGTVIGGLIAVCVLVLLRTVCMLAGHPPYTWRIVSGAGIVIGALLSQLYYALVELLFRLRGIRPGPAAIAPPLPPTL